MTDTKKKKRGVSKMSFFSKSSKGNHYKDGHHGSKHYQKKGLLGSIVKIIGSRSGSSGHFKHQGHQFNNQPPHNQHTHNQSPHNQPINNDSVVCSKCSNQIPAGSKFCLHCGEPVKQVLFCINCGEKLPPNAKFCLKCGKSLNG